MVAIEEIASSLLQVRARNSWSSGAASSRISSKISFGRAANADGWPSRDGVSRSCDFGQHGSLNNVPNDNPYIPWDTKHSPLFGGMILPTDLNVNLPLRIHGQSGAASCGVGWKVKAIRRWTRDMTKIRVATTTEIGQTAGLQLPAPGMTDLLGT